MKTIGVRIGTKQKLKEMMMNDENIRSMDDAVNRLLDESESIGIDRTRVNINLHDETLARLKTFKGYEFESNNDVLARLLSKRE